MAKSKKTNVNKKDSMKKTRRTSNISKKNDKRKNNEAAEHVTVALTITERKEKLLEEIKNAG